MVESVKLAQDKHAMPLLGECIGESIYTMSFEAPEIGLRDAISFELVRDES